jgi:hypothetical protein
MINRVGAWVPRASLDLDCPSLADEFLRGTQHVGVGCRNWLTGIGAIADIRPLEGFILGVLYYTRD